MCLLFFIINDCNSLSSSEYRLILVNNRDEFWTRPTKPAEFWGPDSSCISGLDQEPGYEGGTWLGINRQGHIGCLLNIFGQQDPTKKARGTLVRDFLLSQDCPTTHLQQIQPHVDDFNGFTLILLQIWKNESSAACLSNAGGLAESSVVNLKNNVVHGFGNSSMLSPWQKVIRGKQIFSEIISRHPTAETQADLAQELIQLMSSPTPCLPDIVLEQRAALLKKPPEYAKHLSSIHVWSPQFSYGTRTTTVLLATRDGMCHYYEKDLLVPVDINNPKHLTRHHCFYLDGFASAESCQ